MASYNRIIFMGHLTSDPVGKLVGENMASRFTLAANRKYKKGDETVEEVCFIDVEAWRTQADIAMKYLKKGHLVQVEGRLKQAKWIKDGVEKSKHGIVCDGIVLLEPLSDKTSVPHTSVPITKQDVKEFIKKVESKDTSVKQAENPVIEDIDELPF